MYLSLSFLGDLDLCLLSRRCLSRSRSRLRLRLRLRSRPGLRLLRSLLLLRCLKNPNKALKMFHSLEPKGVFLDTLHYSTVKTCLCCEIFSFCYVLYLCFWIWSDHDPQDPYLLIRSVFVYLSPPRSEKRAQVQKVNYFILSLDNDISTNTDSPVFNWSWPMGRWSFIVECPVQTLLSELYL